MKSISEIRSLMKDTSYETVTRTVSQLSEYILRKENIWKILNPVILSMKHSEHAISTGTMLKSFAVSLKSLIKDTPMIKNDSDVLRIAELIYSGADIEQILIIKARKHFELFEEINAPAVSTTQITPEESLTPGQLRAQKMREAKAKKRLEQEAIQREEEKLNTTAQAEKDASKKLDKEKLETLRMLRGI